MPWVSVTPKDGRAPFFWYDTNSLDFLWKKISDFFFWKVGDIPKEGRAQPRVPILHLVWQCLRTFGTFSCDAAHICFSHCHTIRRIGVGCNIVAVFCSLIDFLALMSPLSNGLEKLANRYRVESLCLKPWHVICWIDITSDSFFCFVCLFVVVMLHCFSKS